MTQFEATIRVQEVSDTDKAAARRRIEERLHAAGFNHFQIVSIGVPAAITPPALTPRRPNSSERAASLGGPLLVAAVTLWALWFLFMIAS
jgi:hypothetical protein